MMLNYNGSLTLKGLKINQVLSSILDPNCSTWSLHSFYRNWSKTPGLHSKAIMVLGDMSFIPFLFVLDLRKIKHVVIHNLNLSILIGQSLSLQCWT